MIPRDSIKLYSVMLMSLLAIVVFAVPTVFAQEEPTPVPEPAQEEPVAAPEEPTPVPEPAPAEPAAEPEEPAPAAQPEAEEPAAAPAPAVAAEPAQEPELKEASVPTVYRDKTRITVNGRAERNGFIELIVKPNEEDPTKVRANIVAKTKTKKITKELVDQLIFALGDRYKVNQTNDKTILVKSKKKMPPVSISLMTQDLAGVSIMIGQG